MTHVRPTPQQCRNWDGGFQEFSTARDAVKAVFPDAEIIQNRIDQYPVKVVIKAELNGAKMDIWSGRQQASTSQSYLENGKTSNLSHIVRQNLFRKYAEKRRSSIAEIQSNLEDLKEEFDIDE